MDLGIAGKWALVCGASKGLGLGCAQALVREGVNLVVNARGADALHQAASQLIAVGADGVRARGQNNSQPQVIAVAADITTSEGRAAVLAAPGGPGAQLDIVVTNAGGPPPGDFRDWDRDAWLAAVEANMLTPIELIRAVVDGMAQRGFGRIVNITSSSVKAPIDILGLSNGARSGLTGFVAGVARSGIAARGVTINNLLPGRFDTDRLAATLRAARAAGPVVGFEAVLNGTVNFMLQRLGEGATFSDALADARAAGFAEEDPSSDLEGFDAEAKVKLLSFEAFGRSPDALPRDVLAAETPLGEAPVRQIGACFDRDGGLDAYVRLDGALEDALFLSLNGERNALKVYGQDGRVWTCKGRGAGRWATTESVLADVADVMRARRAAAELV